ncbi:MAG: response regulator transcription factor [Corticimicrobacter sp.]|uniref:DNA-binding response regulator n=1 Tax=Corticimicrobacter populi TaxID=2175229 RepID=A0A2V1JY57_9BURK|nr:response regulator transcription factor [Corticimicrobacter populi]PWF23824.1 DNA-binding response regulator [Corticimicrobacter populi]
MSTAPIRVLIVEDNPALAANIGEYLDNDRYVLDFAYDGVVALHQVATHEYDVIALDVMLPGMSGFTLCQRIRHDLHSTTPIIMMTAKDHIDDKVEGFSQGADDYLVKPFNLKELAMRIDALHRRGRPEADILRAGCIEFEPGTLRLRLPGACPLQLSGMQAHITEALVRAYPNFLSYEQLGQMLWGEREVEPHTLRTHVYTLRKLLQQALGVNLIQTLHGRGYRLTPPGEA